MAPLMHSASRALDVRTESVGYGVMSALITEIFVRLTRNDGLFNSEKKRPTACPSFDTSHSPVQSASGPRRRNAELAPITRRIIATRVGDNRGNGIVVVELDGSVTGISKGSSSCMSCGTSSVDSIVATS